MLGRGVEMSNTHNEQEGVRASKKQGKGVNWWADCGAHNTGGLPCTGMLYAVSVILALALCAVVVFLREHQR